MSSYSKILLRRTKDPAGDHSQPQAEVLSQPHPSSQSTAPKVPVILKRADVVPAGPSTAPPRTPPPKESKPTTTSDKHKVPKPERKQLLLRSGTPSEPDRSLGPSTTPLSLTDLLATYEFPHDRAVPLIHNDLSFKSNQNFLKSLKSAVDFLVVTVIGPPQSGKTTILNYLAGKPEFNTNPSVFVPRKDGNEKLTTFYITPKNLVLIEMASIFNGGAAVDLISTVDKFSTLESVTSSWNLRLMRFALSVSHLVIVTSLAVLEPKTVQLIHSASNLHPMESAFGGESHAELVFVANRSSLPTEASTELVALCSTADIIGFGRRTRVKPNFFRLPVFTEGVSAKDKEEYELFKQKIHEYNHWTRNPFTPEKIDGQAKIPQALTVSEWVSFSESAWEEMGNPGYYQEYVRFLN